MSRALQRFVVAFLSVAGIFLVAAVAAAIVRAAHDGKGWWGRIFLPGCLPVTVNTAAYEWRAAYLAFVASSIAHFFICFGVAIFAYSTLGSFKFPSGMRWRVHAYGTVVGGLAASWPQAANWPFTLDLLSSDCMSACSGANDLLLRQERASAFVAGLLAFAMAVVVYFARRSVHCLANSMRLASWLLFGGTVLTLSSIVRLGRFYTWLSVALSANPRYPNAGLQAFGNSQMLLWGVCYALLLSIVYAPGLAIMRHRALNLVPRKKAGDRIDAWLQRRGLSFSVTQTVIRVVAMAAPLLPGELAKLLEP